MTKIWGPIGWMTLHSISVCYPDKPTENDKRILNEFLNSFGNTITCMNCRDHFATIFSHYKKHVATWANSRKDLFIAICRLHNTVNKRLDKPLLKTSGECLTSLIYATKNTSQSEFRQKYFEYLLRDWNTFGRSSGYHLLAISDINKMKKINEEYWKNRETPYDSLEFTTDDTLNYPSSHEFSPIKFMKPSFKNVRWLNLRN